MHSKDNQLDKISEYVKQKFSNETTGHDYFHLERVVKNANKIAIEEDANLFITMAAAWLHDIADHKLTTNPKKELNELLQFLKQLRLQHSQIEAIMMIIDTTSYSKGVIPTTIEGKIVQDADRLDALGAIGIARAFAYGGSKQRTIYEPTKSTGSTIHHFYEKLLLLQDSMHTNTGRMIAAERHQYIENFLNQFYKEWEGE
ncbi:MULTISPECIES: HD domain-containing protein [unclassified Oceanobacillus]|uniref:HD domain-containing protein n=1 Tax=unclassified Oceanobacillus TaxID=2630292 RepID=UPI001BECC43B|nr:MULTISPECIES: HD domain-containing protein [unclassified Oceanobacillus]MBT2598506.1 HD domain-containing protein [Oceanobacillus sp. ISL-74]MBT2651424.1 HD domain-containing protein [Oceanobacillus sp. ISL-73]